MRIQAMPVMFGHNHNAALREKKEKLQAFLKANGIGNETRPAAVGMGKDNLQVRVTDHATRHQVITLLRQPGQSADAQPVFEGVNVIVTVNGKPSKHAGCCGNNCCG